MAKAYDELDFTDDFMFCKVLINNIDLAKELLEIILGVQIREVKFSETQKATEITADGRGIRFDVYLEDDEGTIYDVEMQAIVAKEDLPKRTRYYQGMIDLNLIERGARFRELKRTYVIFICLSDPFGKGLPVYTFRNKCEEVPELELGDETEKVFINPYGALDNLSDEMASFLKFLRKEPSAGKLVDQIKSDVEKARAHDEWRNEYMTLMMRDQEMQEKGESMLAKLVSRLLAEGKTDDIQRVTESSDVRKEFYKKYNISM